MSDLKTEDTEDSGSSKIQIEYIKSNLFRVVHTDGAIADSNPNGFITVTLFSQRFSVPEKILIDLDSEGDVINELIIDDEYEKDIDKRIIREVDIISVMDVNIARQLALQILQQLGEYDDEQDEYDDEQEEE